MIPLLTDSPLTAGAVLVLLAFGHRWLAQRGSFLLIMSNLPGTILHELAHFAVALLFGSEPTGFSLWPQRQNNRWQLGSVTARLTTLSAVPAALAPLLWLPVGIILIVKRQALADNHLPSLALVYLAAYICLSAALPSRQDLKVALTHPLSLLLWGCTAGGIWYVATLIGIVPGGFFLPH